MPKQKKEIKYKKEQEEIFEKLLNIIDTNGNKTFTLYEIDNNENKQKEIYDLVSDIKKYFSTYNIGGITEPNRYKRTWLSIIRQLLKRKYNVISGDLTITDNNNEKVRTRIYTLVEK